jgi:membrane-bound serine protease (ClpP class)
MRRISQVALAVVLCPVALGWAVAAEPNASSVPTAGPKEAKAAVIPCKGFVDRALFESVRRRSEMAMTAGTDYLIYEISTYGGLVDAADNIAKYFIQTVGDRAQTVAYVTTEAISAGALISVSCNDIIMRKSTTIGDCAPISMGGTLEGVEREKSESFIRATFQRAAEANGYPALLLQAMVTMQIEVWRVRNLRTGQWDLFEGQKLPSDPNEYDVENAEEIIGSGKLLTLTASQALEYGVARAVVDDLDGALAFLEERDGVVFSQPPTVLKPLWSEHMVSWLYSPAVMAVLIMLALLGVYIEFNTPGLGLPGLVAVICFVIIIGGKYLTGLANWVEIVFLLTGIVLLLIEFLVLPGFGIAGILGIIFLLGGLFGILLPNDPGRLPWPGTPQDWSMLTDGLLGIALGFIGFLVAAAIVTRYLPKLRFMNGLVLVPAVSGYGVEPTRRIATSSREDAAISVKVGAIGKVASRLRPAGKARFGDAVVDVVATGEFLDVGTEIEIIEIHGNRVVVRPADNA